MVATVVLLDVQVTDEVTSRVVPPVNVPVALNCTAFPAIADGLVGVTAMEVKTAVDVAANATACTHGDSDQNKKTKRDSTGLLSRLRRDARDEKLFTEEESGRG